MPTYLLRTSVTGDQYYAVQADSAEEAIEIATDDPWDLPEPISHDISIDGNFELHTILDTD